jgi:general secretion pathway protein D
MPTGFLRLRALVALFATLFIALGIALPAVAASTIAAVRVDAQPSGGALVTITFSGGAAPYRVVGAGTPETAIIFDGAQVGPQIAPTVAGTGPISSVSIAQTGTSSSVALHLTGVAGVRVRAAGSAVVVDVANPAGTTPAGGAFGAPPPAAAAVPATNSETTLVLLKYADVSEIAGVLVAGSTVATNDTFVPTQSNVGASSLGGNTIGGGTGGFAGGGVQQQQTFGNFGAAGAGGGGLAQRLNDNVAIDRRLNAIILTGTPDVIDPLKAMIDRLDIPVPSVLLECEIVELSDTAARNIGLDFSPDGSGIVVNGSNSSTTTGTTTTGTNGYTVHSLQTGQGGFTLSANLYASISEGNGRVLSKPRILAQSGQQASILTGDAIPIFTSVTAANVGVSSQVNYINVGVNLQIAPRVSSDGIVTSHIFSDVSSVTGYTNNAPQISQRTTSTLASVKDGEAFVIGGLLQDNETRSLSKLPFIGDLPVIGALFRHVSTTKQQTNLYIVVTPHIIQPGASSVFTPVGTPLSSPAPLQQSSPPPAPASPAP